jgi:hypothetical protein
VHYTQRKNTDSPIAAFSMRVILLAEETVKSFDFNAPPDQIAGILAADQDGRCCFSDVRTYSGMAYPIRPLEWGGLYHTGNFIYLDPEPGALFASFSWTIGPRLELLIDAYAVTSDIADTVNRSGMLAISDKAITSLDRDALAWHREQFFARLRG